MGSLADLERAYYQAFADNGNAVPTTGGGGVVTQSIAKVKAAPTDNATSTKATPGTVYGWYLKNNAAYDVTLKFYNKASAPAPAVDTALFDICVPAGGGSNIEFSKGIPFSTGIAYAIVKNVAANDDTPVALNDLTGLFLYV